MKFLLSEEVKEVSEMAVAKLPEGMKRKRSATFDSTHDIHVDGKHIATVTGYKPDRYSSMAPTHGYSSQYGKVYTVHHDEEGVRRGVPHKDHTIPGTERAKVYGSMDSAIEAIHQAHQNSKEFGKNHDPKVRWQKAVDLAHGAASSTEKKNQYNQHIVGLRRLGHDDIADQLEKHRDDHIAKSGAVSGETLRRWTHDAKDYMRTKYNHETRSHEPEHPEHLDLAVKANDIHNTSYRY